MSRAPGQVLLHALAHGWGLAFAAAAGIGRTLRLEELPPAVFRQAAAAFMPAAVADDMLRYLAGYVGRPAEMSADFTTVTGLPGTTFAEWAAGHAAAFR